MVTTTEEILTVIARLQDGYDRLDAAALAALHSHDCVVESPVGGVHVGRAAIEHTLRTISRRFPTYGYAKKTSWWLANAPSGP